MKRTIMLTAATAVAALTLAACGGGSDPTKAAGGGATGSSASSTTITVGSADFSESQLLGEIYAGALKAKGVDVKTRPNIGSREVYLKALQDKSIDIVPEYTGSLLTFLKGNSQNNDPNSVYAALKTALPTDLVVLDKSAAEDKNAMVVTKETAAKLSLKSIGDLESRAKDLTLGGPPEMKTRLTGVPGLKRVYNLDFKTFRPLDAGGPLSVQALKNGQVDVANIFTTDPSIAENGFVVLDDPKSLFVAQNVVPLITKSKVNDTISAALNAISAKLNTATLGALLKEVVVDKKDAAVVAKEFLTKNGLG